MSKRPLSELLAVDQPAWPLVQQWLAEATIPVEILPPNELQRGQALEATQVTVRSPMGAIVYESGGLLIDHGWLRILGSGHPRLPRSLPDWNRGRSLHEGEEPPFWLIADDIVGGFFAIYRTGQGQDPGQVSYFAPDTLRWESLHLGYSEFLCWILQGGHAGFYQSLRWAGWEQEASRVPGDQALLIYPFPFTTEGKDLSKCSRQPVPVAEIYQLYMVEFPRQLG